MDGPNEQENKPIPQGPEQQPSWQDSKSPQQQQLENTTKPKWLLPALIILLILILLFFGWLWWKGKDKNKTADTGNQTTQNNDAAPEPAEPACAVGFTDYVNADLGLGFCYPTVWGSVTVNDAKFEAADAGSRWTFSFTAKAMVNLGVVSLDWATTVPRDGTCVDPAVQTMPAFVPFSTTWAVDGTPASSATRGIEVLADTYLINEEVDEMLGNGACLRGYTIINGIYPHTAASYSAEFTAAVSDPDQHIADPNILIPATERADFAAFVKSVRKEE